MTTITALSVMGLSEHEALKLFGGLNLMRSRYSREHRSRGPARGGSNGAFSVSAPGALRLPNNNREGKKMVKALTGAMVFGAFLLILFLGLMVAVPPAHAGVSCNNKTDSINGKIGGNPFGFSADSRNFIGDDDNFVRLQSEDCVRDSELSEANQFAREEAREAFKDAKRDARRSAATAAALDAFAWEPGLNISINGANAGLEDDTYAAGLNLGYKHQFANPGVIHGFSFKAGFASDTTWDEQTAVVGATINFGTF